MEADGETGVLTPPERFCDGVEGIALQHHDEIHVDGRARELDVETERCGSDQDDAGCRRGAPQGREMGHVTFDQRPHQAAASAIGAR